MLPATMKLPVNIAVNEPLVAVTTRQYSPGDICKRWKSSLRITLSVSDCEVIIREEFILLCMLTLQFSYSSSLKTILHSDLVPLFHFRNLQIAVEFF